MTRWIGIGLRTGIKTSRFPRRPREWEAGVPAAVAFDPGGIETADRRAAAELCPTDAIRVTSDAGSEELRFDAGQCVMCGRCVRAYPRAFRYVTDPRVAVRSRTRLEASAGLSGAPAADADGDIPALADEVRRRARRVFGHSLHIRHVDAGSCNGCESELQMLGTPYYDLHRLGLFFTPTPRHADLLLVTGVVTERMEAALLKTYQAMPHPKLVMAAGVCAIGGGIFAGTGKVRGPLDRLLPVDVYVPGCPPSPLALLHGLLLTVGRAEERYNAQETRDGA